MDLAVDQVCVGAGPIGLLCTIGLLSKEPGKKMLIIEQYNEYQRNHVVRVKAHLLQAFANQCGLQHHPKMQALIQDIKRNPYIKTKSLESQLKAIAIELGAQIKIQKVKDISQDILESYPNAQLIIGADGTHSTVSTQIFGGHNQIKFPFDYVLQARFEMDGNVQRMERLELIKYMQSYGIVASEYVGKENLGGTPITLQIMISAQEFEQLYPHATSKNPIRPFHNEEVNHDKIPPKILHVLKGYLGLRLRHFTKPEQTLFLNDVKLSVNEAPATRAKEVVAFQNGKTFVLAGDAALGLSYFKGLNAGIESITRLIPALATLAEQPAKIIEYAHWFDSNFAPAKINEVAYFSHLIVRPGVQLFYWLNRLIDNEVMLSHGECDRSVALYDVHLKHHKESTWVPYSHRKNTLSNPVLSFLPALDAVKQKYKKYCIDWLKPYKSNHHLLKDVAQPLIALKHVLLGSIKSILAIPIFCLTSIFLYADGDDFLYVKNNFNTAIARVLEGLFETTLGIFLIATLPLMPFKILSRMLMHNNKPPIENNRGIQRIIQACEEPHLSTYDKASMCMDLHRKFQKSSARGQTTRIDENQEKSRFQKCLNNETDAYTHYVQLFKPISPSRDADYSSPLIIEQHKSDSSQLDYMHLIDQLNPSLRPLEVRQDGHARCL